MTIAHRSFTATTAVAITATAAAALLLVAMSTASFAGSPPGKGNANKGNANKGNASNSQSTGSFWYGNHSNQGITDLVTAGITLVAARELALSTASVGYKPLPPGIAKNLARGKSLPPGITTRHLSDPLLKGLPQYNGYQWLGAGSDLVLINMTSRMVADVLVNALR